MSSAKVDETTLFMGQDVVTKETLKLFEKAVTEMNAIATAYNKAAKTADTFMSGFIVTCRKQFFQAGGGAKTNYFTHAARAQRENNVLTFLGQ
jgi:hypothetical protein